jgi:hypothetical protein
MSGKGQDPAEEVSKEIARTYVIFEQEVEEDIRERFAPWKY